MLLAKSKLRSMKVLISTALTDSNVSHDEFVLINNMLKTYNEMKEEIKKVLSLNHLWELSKILVYLLNNAIILLFEG